MTAHNDSVQACSKLSLCTSYSNSGAYVPTDQLIISATPNHTGNILTVTNAPYQQSTVLTIPDPGGNSAVFMLSAGNQAIQGALKLNGTNVSQTWCQAITASQMVSGGKETIWATPSSTAQIVITGITVLASVSLGGGGGDRLLSLTDGTLVFNGTGITAALLETPVFTTWGGTGNPLPASTVAPISTPGQNVYFQYSGGTADYTIGTVRVAVTFSQIAN